MTVPLSIRQDADLGWITSDVDADSHTNPLANINSNLENQYGGTLVGMINYKTGKKTTLGGDKLPVSTITATSTIFDSHPIVSEEDTFCFRSFSDVHVKDIDSTAINVDDSKLDDFHKLYFVEKLMQMVAADDAAFKAVSYTHLTLTTNREV